MNFQSTRKLDTLKTIESSYKKDTKIEVDSREKYIATFPYPYMNGILHLGHLFTLSKADFKIRFEQLRGKNAFLPIAFHCTGMPIAAAAQKLREGDKTQENILKQIGIGDIEPFKEPTHWARVFPISAKKTISDLNVAVDWRRSFVTTDLNPFYDSFVRWQFGKLKKKGLLSYGKRFSIFCPKDNQPCLDHDRQKGEGVVPIPIYLLKFELKRNEIDEKMTMCLNVKNPGRPLYIEAPSGLVLHKVLIDNKVYLFEDFVYRNIKEQLESDYVDSFKDLKNYECFFDGKKVEVLKKEVVFVKTVEDESLKFGAQINLMKNKTPIKKLNESDFLVQVYTPESHVVSRSGSECVVALLDQWFVDYNDPDWKKIAIKAIDAMVTTDNDVISALKDAIGWIDRWAFSRTFGLGTRVPWDTQYLIDSLSDSTIYMSFYTFNHLLFEDMFGANPFFPVEKLCDCVWNYIFSDVLCETQTMGGCDNEKCLFIDENINTDEINRIIRRRNNEHQCYMEKECNEFIEENVHIRKHISVNTGQQGILLNIDTNLGKNDEILNNEDNKNVGASSKIEHSETCELTCKLSECFKNGQSESLNFFEILENCRKQLNHFYPVDLRVSGKDLIKNHLIFFIFNHVALFKEQYWPRRIEANGHLMLNSEKMSKSTGNFMTGDEAIKKYGESATRMSLATCGDGLNDANFVEENANSYILRLFNFIESARVANIGLEEDEFCEHFLKECIERNTILCTNAYESMKFADVIKYGFFEMLNDYETYVMIGGAGNNKHLYDRITILMYPIVPSISEYLSKELKIQLKLGEKKETKEYTHIMALEYVKKVIKLIQWKIKKTKCKCVKIGVSDTYKDWQIECIKNNTDSNTFQNIMKEFNIEKRTLMEFITFYRQNKNLVNEMQVLKKLKQYIEKIVGISVDLVWHHDTFPMNPIIMVDKI